MAETWMLKLEMCPYKHAKDYNFLNMLRGKPRRCWVGTVYVIWSKPSRICWMKKLEYRTCIKRKVLLEANYPSIKVQGKVRSEWEHRRMLLLLKLWGSFSCISDSLVRPLILVAYVLYHFVKQEEGISMSCSSSMAIKNL